MVQHPVRTIPAADPCPKDHVEYLSTAVANNAVTLHYMRVPHCPGMAVLIHGDHFHVGHSYGASRICRDRDDSPLTVRRRYERRGRAGWV